jgi:hypothetical protein
MNFRDKKKVIDEMDHIQLYANIIKQEVRLGRAIRSPLRDDTKPSFGIYRGQDGKIKWKDFAEDGGDIYSLVMKIENVDFVKAVDSLYKTLGHIDYTVKKNDKVEYRRIVVTPSELIDNKIFKDMCIDPDVFLKYGGHQISDYQILTIEIVNGMELIKKTVYFHCDSPSFAYLRRGKCMKLYFPTKDKKYRYKAAPTDGLYFGYTEERKKNFILMAGEKDVLTWASIPELMSEIYPICLSGESNIFNYRLYDMIKSVCDGNIYILYDNDKTGKTRMNQICEDFPDMICLGNSHDIYKQKDFNDIICEVGYESEVWNKIIQNGK